MKNALLLNFAVDKAANTIHVQRGFDAPLPLVWDAWTKSELLDQWWAPKPWQARTKSQDFTEGGRWLYAMVGPEGEEHWALAEYKTIIPEQKLDWLDAFCDENGQLNQEFPRSLWNNTFSETEGTTMVDITLKFEKLEDLEKIIEMGFREGFTAGLENLDELLSKQQTL